jgi:Tripartite tricarboxylate transporter TctB family
LRIKNFKDFYTGLLFMLFGAAFTWGAVRYSMGNAAKMGPGYFPFILGGLLTVLGVIVFTRSLVSASDDSSVGRIFIKPALLMFGSIAAFALLLRTAGLVVSIFAIILISSLASDESRFKETLISAVVLCLASLAMFVYGLNLRIPVWPSFIAR